MGDAHSIPPAGGSDSNASGSMAPSGRQLVHAGVLADANGAHVPGALLLEGGRIIAAGDPSSIGPVGDDVALLDHREHLVCPPFVNAHVHLDLSDLEAPAEMGSFQAWLWGVLRHRKAQEEAGAVERAVEIGAKASLAGGCPFVADICGSDRALEALYRTGLGGLGCLEVIGHGDRTASGLERIRDLAARDCGAGRIMPGISPHAPYSTGAELYDAASASGRQVVTHLAESRAEVEWCLRGAGAFAAMLQQSGYDPDQVTPPGRHPIDSVLPLMPGGRGVVVHLNYAEPRHLELLADHGVTVVFCPRASRYLGHPDESAPPHAWRAMLEHGIPVALGTDGRPCLPGPGVRGRRLSVLDDALALCAFEGARLEEWLPMATVHGARALGLDPDEVTLAPGPKSGLLSIPLSDIEAGLPDPEGGVDWLLRDLDRVPAWVSGA